MNEFRIARLTSASDLDPPRDADAGTRVHLDRPQHVPALLNCEMIDAAGAKLAALGADGGERLPWFAAPFRVAVTVANLRGVPHRVLGIPRLGDFSGAAYVKHDDFAWFAFPNGTAPGLGGAAPAKREDEFWLGPGAGAGSVGMETLVAYATASGAMPVGLAARALSRPAEHYLYRPAVRPIVQDDGRPGFRIDWPEPASPKPPRASTASPPWTAAPSTTTRSRWCTGPWPGWSGRTPGASRIPRGRS